MPTLTTSEPSVSAPVAVLDAPQVVPPASAIAAAVHSADVGKRFVANGREVVALKGLDLTIRPSEFLSIIGGSGCGKSTFLRIIAGLETNDTGTITIDGKPIKGPGLDRGMMFQDHRLLPWLTVQDNLAFALHRVPRDEARERIARHLKLVGLTGFEKAYPHQLSGGMAQRAAIARVLINRPRLLLLDEPFGALDALTKIQMQEELLRIWEQERLTVVLVTHDIDEAVFLGDRVAIMSSRPGSMRRIVDVDLPRPRDRSGAQFVGVRKQLYGEFFSVAEKPFAYEI